MSQRLNLSITRSSLLQTKDELMFAQEGHDLLEQKREVLIMETVVLIETWRKWKKEAEQSLHQAYQSLEEALVVLGKESIMRASFALSSQEEIRISGRSIMGVLIPLVSYSQRNVSHHQYGFLGTSISLDRTVRYFSAALEKLARLAGLEVSLRRLATELKKTQHRANALHFLFIPEYRETVKYLENALEEKEREGFFQLKRAHHSALG